MQKDGQVKVTWLVVPCLPVSDHRQFINHQIPFSHLQNVTRNDKTALTNMTLPKRNNNYPVCKENFDIFWKCDHRAFFK